jgi:hypothetical protein
MLIWLSIAVLVLIAAIIVVARDRIARLQSLLAGGAVMPGCAIAEAVALLLLALLIFLGDRAGMFSTRSSLVNRASFMIDRSRPFPSVFPA